MSAAKCFSVSCCNLNLLSLPKKYVSLEKEKVVASAMNTLMTIKLAILCTFVFSYHTVIIQG